MSSGVEVGKPNCCADAPSRPLSFCDSERVTLFGNYQLANSLDGKSRISTEMSATGSFSVFTVERRSICCHPGP
jgi:hypothetical protein